MASSSRLPRAMVALLLVLSLSSTLLPTVHTRTVDLVNFEFENRVPPGNTVIVSAAPSGNTSLSNSEFGTIKTVTNVLRQGNLTNSTVLGSVVGLLNVVRDGSLYATYSFVYQSQEYNGTIGVQGTLSAQGTGELGVTSGTGSFRNAEGWVISTLISANDPTNVLFQNFLHLESLDD